MCLILFILTYISWYFIFYNIKDKKSNNLKIFNQYIYFNTLIIMNAILKYNLIHPNWFLHHIIIINRNLIYYARNILKIRLFQI